VLRGTYSVRKVARKMSQEHEGGYLDKNTVQKKPKRPFKKGAKSFEANHKQKKRRRKQRNFVFCVGLWCGTGGDF